MAYGAVAGSVFGLAYGDAMGAPTEFLSYAEIMRRHDVPGPRELPVHGGVAMVTDDTQMALAVADALVSAREDGHALTPQRLNPRLRGRFLAWWDSPDNNRAPGNTCLKACRNLATGMAWEKATVRGSKGCGANMRVTPVGLLDGVSEADRCGASQLQSALTHGHPTALAASDLTAAAVHALRAGVGPRDLPAYLRAHAAAQREVYHGDWLGDELWRGPFGTTPEAFIARGWDECLGVLDRLDAALLRADRRSDPCQATGAGWIAEEAFATGLLCFLLYEDSPVDTVARAAATSGDSDSIAALAGAFAGVWHGVDAWPQEWSGVIEYRDELERLSGALSGVPGR
ncbi:ADP-ribosylglycohydrolase family protein [Yinghuangia seranimata]|uniref:ADP-ribosylglycohydrolase family protein n=1 Tax=Yinghuangia seranimata TaxID=408067 RepID=UPI00248CF971|nr:ADP-ribosylglycohydrolase family protein [Yinghuangia seranimata]MDI2129158.1 ADP-ribosylglycohydrolase family protein [Yinghuangia seranimata]